MEDRQDKLAKISDLSFGVDSYLKVLKDALSFRVDETDWEDIYHEILSDLIEKNWEIHEIVFELKQENKVINSLVLTFTLFYIVWIFFKKIYENLNENISFHS